MKFLTTLLLTHFIWILPASLAAEDRTKTLEPIKIQATRGLLEEENPTAAITIITRDEIEKKQHMQVKDILREQLGINVVNIGTIGGTTTVFMRGANSQSTLVLIDGVQVKSNTVGSFDFSDLQMDNIERIEVMRGPQSTYWGADAVGGVINIVTRRGGGKPETTLSFEGGSFATFRETLASTGTWNNVDYAISGSKTNADGYSSFNERRGAVENDGYQNTTLSSRLGYNFLEDGRIEFIGRFIHSRIDTDVLDASFVQTDSNPDTKTSDTYYWAIPIQKSIFGWWDVKLNTNFYFDDQFTIDTNPSPFVGNTRIISRTFTTDFQNNITPADFVNLIFGYEYQDAQGENTSESNAFFEMENRSHGIYFSSNWNYKDPIGQSFLTAGFRYDVNSRFQNKLTYKIEGAYAYQQTRLRLAYATGFRVPSANEVLFPFFGNANIQPEESKNWEIGLEQSLLKDRVTIGITYFETNLTNEIIFDLVTNVTQNIGKSSSNGLESQLRVNLMSSLDVSVLHTWNEAVDDTTHTTLARRPRNTLTAQANYRWNDRLDMLVSYNYRSAMKSGLARVGGRGVVRAALAYRWDDHLKLTVRGENLLDKNYEESFEFGTAGISAFAGFVYTFN